MSRAQREKTLSSRDTSLKHEFLPFPNDESKIKHDAKGICGSDAVLILNKLLYKTKGQRTRPVFFSMI